MTQLRGSKEEMSIVEKKTFDDVFLSLSYTMSVQPDGVSSPESKT